MLRLPSAREIGMWPFGELGQAWYSKFSTLFQVKNDCSCVWKATGAPARAAIAQLNPGRIYHKRRYSQSLARLPWLGLPAALGRLLRVATGSKWPFLPVAKDGNRSKTARRKAVNNPTRLLGKGRPQQRAPLPL